VSGDITVLTVRTDLVQDGTMKKYAAEFNKIYPKVKVEFQALTNYEAEIKIRMNTED
jgi:raffinose/stachyose/melibiose transport system substrate-binding protein